MTMNLCEFFECMDPETVVIVECNGENIFFSFVCDISEDESVAYWIKSKSIVFKDGVMLIPVEHQDEINKYANELIDKMIEFEKKLEDPIFLEKMKMEEKIIENLDLRSMLDE